MILFDVGAHHGQDSLDITQHNPNVICYAFEPTPELARLLRIAAEARGMKDRYHVYEQAISDFDGEADFHMVENDTGSASLNDFPIIYLKLGLAEPTLLYVVQKRSMFID
jgi:FkbM family methyltransferase